MTKNGVMDSMAINEGWSAALKDTKPIGGMIREESSTESEMVEEPEPKPLKKRELKGTHKMKKSEEDILDSLFDSNKMYEMR